MVSLNEKLRSSDWLDKENCLEIGKQHIKDLINLVGGIHKETFQVMDNNDVVGGYIMFCHYITEQNRLASRKG